MTKTKHFLKGLYNAVPIGLGYLFVSFSFGIMAVKSGLTTAQATVISATNLTSAGQAAGVEIIADGGTIIQIILTQLLINLRYALMAIALSQKLAPEFTMPHRVFAAFGITDEIFAMASMEKSLNPFYMYGMIVTSAAGWVTGTFLGASAGSILPASISDALGIMLYGMFAAIVIPEARKQKSVLVAALTAAAFSVFFKFVIKTVPVGFVIIICASAAAAVAAVLFPVKDEEEQEAAA